jgi:hypothetical protein
MRITDFPELIAPTGNDLLVTVDIANDLTKKVKLDNLPISLPALTALATKQNTLVSGTNIKTINSTTLLGSGDITVQPTLVSGVSLKTVNSTSLLGSGDIPIPIVTPSGVTGAIQFSNGSAFASDAANLFWDDTNNRLGVGTNAPNHLTEFLGAGMNIPSSITSPVNLLLSSNFSGVGLKLGLGTIQSTQGGGAGTSAFALNINPFGGNTNFGTTSDLGARVGIRGTGSTSATTSLLVQNSAGTEWFRIYDNGTTTFAGNITAASNIECFSTMFVRGQLWGGTTNDLRLGTNGFGNAMAIASATGDVSISTSLTLNSTTKGFLPPRMTTTQKNAIASPAAGLVVYDSTTNKLQCYNGSTWNDLF